ncbi:MAG: hypothetical protein LBQ47_02705, partial [Endomicrobium sp.]|nr:hypothetical protein [Endomicrobium sp.]
MTNFLPEKNAGGRFIKFKNAKTISKIERWNILTTVFAFLGILFEYISIYIKRTALMRKYLRSHEKKKYFDINGAKVAFMNNPVDLNTFLLSVFHDTFLISCNYNDNYDRAIVEALDPYMQEGPYGYKDKDFDVTIKQNDIVIDAGAWIGDFSAYAASKNAIVYSFEPVAKTYELLM